MSPDWESLLQLCLAALWRASWQGSIAIAAAFLIECGWKNMPVVWRSWMWRCVFIKLLLAMLIPGSLALPILPARSMNTTKIIREGGAAAELASRTALDSAGVSPSQKIRSAGMSPSPKLAIASKSINLLPWLLIGLWTLGFGGYLSLQHWHGRRVMARLERSRVILHRAVERMLQTLATNVGLAQPPQVRVSPGMGSPCVIGGWQPIILLPADWLRICTHNQLRLAVAHELAHLARGDLAWNRLAALCQAAFFFHPLVWFAARRYHVAQELACDELALGRTNGSPVEYARLLLQFVEQRTEPHWAGAVSMTGATVTLRERILAMNRVFPSTSPAASSFIMASLLAILGFVPLTFAEQTEPKSSSEPQSKQKEQSSAPKKKNVDIKKSASASASASSGAFGFGAAEGLGTGVGQQGGFVGGKAEAKAKVSVSVSTGDDDEEKKPDQETSQPKSQSKPESSKPNTKTSKSSMKQSMKSTNNGDGEKWSRTTEASENGKDYKIVENNEKIAVTISEDGSNEKTYTAANAKELATKYPEAHEVYKKYGAPKGTASAKVSKGSFAGGKAGGLAGGGAGGGAGGIGGLKGLDVEGLGDLEGLDLKEFAAGAGEGNNKAKELMKQQLKKILESDEVRGTPLEKLLEDAQKQFEDE